MARLRWASGIALVALTATACGMGGDDTDTNGRQRRGKAVGGGHVVYAEQFAACRRVGARRPTTPITLMRAGCLETLVKYEADGELEPRTWRPTWEQVEPNDVGVHAARGRDLPGRHADGCARRWRARCSHVLDAETPARSFNPDVVSGVEAVDESTVQITTPAPDVLLPLRVASPNTGILAPKAYEGEQIDIQGTCTGPFTVADEAPRQSLTLERNESYWGGDVALATAEVRFIVDGATRATQLQTGEAQIAPAHPGGPPSTRWRATTTSRSSPSWRRRGPR